MARRADADRPSGAARSFSWTTGTSASRPMTPPPDGP